MGRRVGAVACFAAFIGISAACGSHAINGGRAGGDTASRVATIVAGVTEAAAQALPTSTPTLTDSEIAAAAATAAFVASEEATAQARPTDTPLPSATPIPPPYKLALISASCTQRTDIGFNECQGFVKNISGTPLQNVEVVIQWADANGVPQSADDALIAYNPILSGQESPWSTVGTYNPALGHFRVQFKDLLGGTILTRDDRQQ